MLSCSLLTVHSPLTPFYKFTAETHLNTVTWPMKLITLNLIWTKQTERSLDIKYSLGKKQHLKLAAVGIPDFYSNLSSVFFLFQEWTLIVDSLSHWLIVDSSSFIWHRQSKKHFTCGCCTVCCLCDQKLTFSLSLSSSQLTVCAFRPNHNQITVYTLTISACFIDLFKASVRKSQNFRELSPNLQIILLSSFSTSQDLQYIWCILQN